MLSQDRGVLTAIAADFIGFAVLSIGLLIAAYYAATALACVVYFAPQMRTSAASLLMKGILPAVGAAMMIAAFVLSALDMYSPDYVGLSWLGIGTVFWTGIGALVIGAIVTALLRTRFREFFSAETIPRGNVTTRAELATILTNETEA